MPDRILELLRLVERGALDPEVAAQQIRMARETDLGFAVVDDEREQRVGLPEVVYGAGKSAAQIGGLLDHIVGRGQKALATRVDPQKAEEVLAAWPDATYEPISRLLWRAPEGVSAFEATAGGPVWVVCAGTSDLPVAEEASRCAEWFGLEVHRATDVGVAGLHRLLSRLEGLRKARAIVVAAGMEGALPSVVAGLVSAPVIAVPTSVGYGAALGGLTALLAMVNSCAAGVSVVNIDNGFGAAQVAWRIVRGGT